MPEFTITKIPNTEREQNIKYRKKTFVSPKKSMRQKTREDPRLTETFKIIQDISERRQTPKIRDDCSIFGELVGSKLRKLDNRNRLIAQQQINNILFNAEMSNLYSETEQVRQVVESPTPTFSPSPSVYEVPRFQSQQSPVYPSSTHPPSLQDMIQFSQKSPSTCSHSSESLDLQQYQLLQQAPSFTPDSKN